MKKTYSSLAIFILATIFLVTACQKNQHEVASFNAGNSVVEQELYRPDVQGINREFTLTLPLSSRPQKVTTEIKDNLVIMDGDIILGNVVEFEGSNAVAIDGASYRWTNSIIPYVISAGHPKKTDIEWAIQHVSSTTNICLVPRTNEANYIQFVSGSGCASYVWKTGWQAGYHHRKLLPRKHRT